MIWRLTIAVDDGKIKEILDYSLEETELNTVSPYVKNHIESVSGKLFLSYHAVIVGADIDPIENMMMIPLSSLKMRLQTR